MCLAGACGSRQLSKDGGGRDAAATGGAGAGSDAAADAVPRAADTASDEVAADARTTAPADAAPEDAPTVDAVASCEGDACPRRAKAVAVNGNGPWQACALFTDGTVECWVNGLTAGGPAGAPVLVDGLTGATAIAVGGSRGCAILAGGAVSCWTDMAGQGLTGAAVVPELTGVTALSLGDLHSCALLDGGQPVCWGYNGQGELGNGAISNEATTTPGPVEGLTNVTSIAVGEYHTCASDSNGVARCWGQNDQGQLGFGPQDGFDSGYPHPLVVPGLAGVASVSARGGGTCALRVAGDVFCWGTPTTTPVHVAGIGAPRALAVSTGWFGSCAVLADGHLACWGGGSHGTLGDGMTTTSSNDAALIVPGLANVVDVSASMRACAVAADGGVSCWGPRTYYSTGITDDDLVPVPVAGL